jgi:hypothetical protein
MIAVADASVLVGELLRYRTQAKSHDNLRIFSGSDVRVCATPGGILSD